MKKWWRELTPAQYKEQCQHRVDSLANRTPEENLLIQGKMAASMIEVLEKKKRVTTFRQISWVNRSQMKCCMRGHRDSGRSSHVETKLENKGVENKGLLPNRPLSQS